MNPQIEQLRTAFNGYNNTQKKQFIDNLKAKTQGMNNPEYSRLLNECVQKYNTAIRIANRPNDTAVSAPTQTPVVHMPTTPQGKQKNPLKGVVIALSLILVLIVGGLGFMLLSDSGSPNAVSVGSGGNANTVVELTADNIRTYLNISYGFSNLDTRRESGFMGTQERITTATMTVTVEPRRNVEFSNASVRLLFTVGRWGNQEEFIIHLPFDGRTSTSRDISTRNILLYGDAPTTPSMQFTLITGEVTYN